MEWLPLLYQILEICIIPLLGILTTYIVKYIKAKSAEIQVKVDNDTADKYIAMLSDTITACVIATNQTYVETLKKEDKFDLEAQKIAFQKRILFDLIEKKGRQNVSLATLWIGIKFNNHKYM